MQSSNKRFYLNWIIWFSLLVLFVINSFLIVDYAYMYRKRVSELATIKKQMRTLERVQTELKTELGYQRSLPNVEKKMAKQKMTTPKKIVLTTLEHE